MNQSIGELLKRVLREAWSRKLLVSFIYMVTSVTFLVLAIIWPRIYTSSSTVFVEQQNIMSQLLGDDAALTSATDHAKVAREVVFSRKATEHILGEIDWFDGDEASPAEKELKAEDIRSKTAFNNQGDNLIKIVYRDVDATRAYQATKLMTSIFIEESLKTKRDESRAAHDFISRQVEEYHTKLSDAETAINDFRSKNIDSTPGSESAVNERIIQLRRQVERAEMEIYEEESKLKSTQRQLSGEQGSENTASILIEGQLNTRIEELEERLANLRLTYMDNYPDIVQLKNQIKALEGQIDKEIENRKNGSGKVALRNGPIAQELRRQILRNQTTLNSLKSRRLQIEKLLKSEKDKKDRIYAVKSEIAELMRDFDVNQQKYQDLLARRENAYISMNIDKENQGMSIKIQESASLPISPKGIRFAHIVLAGLVFAFAVPIGVAYALSLIDQKVRDVPLILDKLNLTIIGMVYPVRTPAQTRENIKYGLLMALIVLVNWGLYGYQVYLKMVTAI